MAAQHVEKSPDRVGAAVDVAHVGVLRDEAERAFLTAAADHDARPARLERARYVQRLLDPVVLALEARRLFGEHGSADLQRLLEPVEPLAGRRKVEPQRFVLLLVPG